MNFYFCESCGKRITDEEIQAGKGRDKKLKGVYCADCALGVSTMEMLPVTDADLKVGKSSDDRSGGAAPVKRNRPAPSLSRVSAHSIGTASRNPQKEPRASCAVG